MRSIKSENDIGRGWAWFVLIASYGTIMVVCMSMYMSGVLYVAFLDTYKEGAAKTSIIGALNTGLYAVIGPFASVLINIFSCRTSMVFGGLLCSLCYFIAYFLNTIDLFIVVLGLFVGIGISLSFVPATVVLAYNFKEKRRLIISLASVAPGVGMFAASPFCLFLLETFGLKGTLLIISGINLQVCVFGVICRPSSLELAVQRENKERKLNLNRKHKNSSLNSTLNERLLKLKRLLNIDLLCNSSFFSFLLSALAWGFMYSLLLVHLPNFVLRTDVVDADINGVMSVFSVSTIIGRILTALTVEKGGLDSLTLHTGMCGVIGVVTVLLPFYGHLPGSAYVYAGITGAYIGGLNTLLCPITLMIVGVEKFSTAHGMAYLFCGIGQIIGPYLGGILFGITKSYNSTFIIGGVVVLCGSFLGMLSSVKSQRKLEDANPLDNYTIEINGQGTTENRSIVKDKTTERNDVKVCDCQEQNSLL